jgi:hypothetical protein
VRSFSSNILAQMGAFDQSCTTYSPAPGQTAQQCYTKQLAIKVKAGDVIGAAGGLDLSLFDSRVTPMTVANASRWQTSSDGFDRFHTVAFSDYYAEPARSQVRALLGQHDGLVKRTIEPLGGSIATDVAGTAQGTWFNPAGSTTGESPHFSITPDNVDPTRYNLGFGTSHPGFSTGVYRMYPSTSGNINKPPAQITPGPTIYCYDVTHFFGTLTFARLLLQLSDATTLVTQVTSGGGTCAANAPWAFSAGANFTFRR